MEKRKNDPLKRRVNTRSYRDVCWISAEGQTERDYFKMDVFKSSGVSVKYPKQIHPNRTDPEAVKKRLEKEFRDVDFRKNDEAWVVVDVDEWSLTSFNSLVEWAKGDCRRHVAISNPKFELFLVMHYEKANGCTDSATIDNRLKRYMPGYDKRISPRCFTKDDVLQAVKNSRRKIASCKSAVPDPGMTQVHSLAERLID